MTTSVSVRNEYQRLGPWQWAVLTAAMLLSGVVLFGPLLVGGVLWFTFLRDYAREDRRRVMTLAITLSIAFAVVVWTLFLSGAVGWFVYSA